MTESSAQWTKDDRDRATEEATLLILEWLAEQGIDALLRVDALRMHEGRPPWTFFASGGPLDHGLRADARTAGRCMVTAVSRLREAGVRVPLDFAP